MKPCTRVPIASLSTGRHTTNAQMATIPADIQEFVAYANWAMAAEVEKEKAGGTARETYMYYPLQVRAVPKGKPKFYALCGPPEIKKYGYTAVRIRADETRGLYTHAGTKPYCTLAAAGTELTFHPQYGLRLNKEARKRADERRSQAAKEIAKRRAKPEPIQPLTRKDGSPLQVGDILTYDQSYTGLEHNHVFFRLVAIGKTLRVRKMRSVDGAETRWHLGHYCDTRPDEKNEPEGEETCIRLDGHVQKISSWNTWRLEHYDPTHTYVNETRLDA